MSNRANQSRLRRNVLLFSSFGLVLAAGGCACEEESGISRLRPDIKTFDPRLPEDQRPPQLENLSFEEVPLGASKILAVAVKNTGNEVLRICLKDTMSPECTDPSRIQPEPSPFGAVFENPAPDSGAWVVEKGAEREFSVAFTPGEEGEFTATLIVMHNASDRTSTITLTGKGVAPRIDFNTDMIDFGQVTVDQRVERDLVLTNGTQFTQPIRIDPLAQPSVIFGVADVNGNVAPATEVFAAEVPGNGSLTLKVWFQPPEEGQYMNTLNVSYCPTCARQISLRGEGIKPVFELDPSHIPFGSVDEQTPVARSFVVRNVGNVPLTVFSVGLEVGTTMEFNPSPQATLPAVLAPQETLVVDVSYVGTTPGDDMGRVEVVTNAWDNPETPFNERVGYVSLAARSTGPDINPFPPVVNFGTVAIGGTAMRPASLQNVGNEVLQITSLQLINNSPEIRLMGTPALPVNLQPGESVDLNLTYSPIDAGPDTGEIEVISNDRDEGTVIVPISGIGGVPTTCSINVAPSQLTFGLVERGRVATLPVEIRNGGMQPCSISGLRLNGAGEFTLAAGTMTALTVAPGGTHRVRVSYAPMAYGTHATLLEFASDDPGQNMVTVPISGASDVSDVLVIPSQLDFAVVPVTCRSPTRTVTVYNTGASVVTINNVYLDPTTTAEFELTPFMTPRTLGAGASAVINMRYHPTDIGSDTGVLFIDHSASLVPVAVPLSGEGQISPTVTDTFQQLPTPQADVLFVVDDSCSMSEEQGSLGANLNAFLSFAQAEGIDYHIGVTTTDVNGGGEQGRFVTGANGNMTGAAPRFITPQTANVNTVFQQRVSQGTGGSGTERGLEAAYLALSDPLINTHNVGFLRTDAALAVIFVSDEEDQSSRAVTFYEDFLRNIKGFQNSAMFSASAVVGIQAGGCNGPGGSADYGARYISVANNTGGVVESICSANWGQTLANIGLNSFGLRRQFQLSSQPVPVTIDVRVNSNRIPSTSAGGQMNWSYDPSTNTITFTAAAVPAAGSNIAVTYTVACLP